MKIVSIIGARPQIIKAFVVGKVLRERHTDVLVHTGQHYDDAMSAQLFEELGLAEPDVNLRVGSDRQGAQTGLMLERIEDVLVSEQPDWVVVYGDTNSTLAGALAAAKLGQRVAHVEAGLRSLDRRMPEEINRIVTDHVSDLLLCPSQTAVDNLANEGIWHGVHLVGDVMADALEVALERAQERPPVLARLDLSGGDHVLATVHRAGNVDDASRFQSILAAIDALQESVVFPVHPRTREAMAALAYMPSPHVHLVEPVSYFEMVSLERRARLILTDSGGVQKEAYWLGVPCVTLRDETEWVETVEAGWNVLVGADTEKIIRAAESFSPSMPRPPLYGGGGTAERCVVLMEEYGAG